MAFTSITNYGEYISAHYLAALMKNDLEGLRKRWAQADKAAADTSGPASSAQGIKALGQRFFTLRNRITEQLGEAPTDDALLDARVVNELRDLNDTVLRALAYVTPAQTDATATWVGRGHIDVTQLDQERQVRVALAVSGTEGLELVALDTTWASDAEGIVDQDAGSRLVEPIKLDGDNAIDHAGKAIEFLFACEEPPRYVLLLAGNVVLLADRAAWPHGYLAVNLSQALHAKEDKPGGELETIAALFGAESLITFEGQTALADLVDKGRKHAIKVSKELREALRQSVELIAQEILDRIRAHDADPDDLGDDLARRLSEQALRYLYRMLFLLYAEARPELGILPSRNDAYKEGYGLARLGEIVSYDLPEESEDRLHFYESLRLLFTLVDQGHRPRRTDERIFDDGHEIALDTDGIRFEALKSDLFDPDRTSLIGEMVKVGQVTVDTRLRNKCLWQVINLLMLTPEPGAGRGRRRAQRGFISYAQLGINQLGAVYEGLMSYTGFFAPEDVYEVAKTVKSGARTNDREEREKPDPSKGTWIVPVRRAGDYDRKYFVERIDPITGESKRIIHRKGSFVYRLSGRERQRSASYYTPEVLTECTVKHALAELLSDETTSRDILDLRVCEPALGSGAFLNEAINQLAHEYIERAQHERGVRLLPDQLETEKQKVKAYLALHNCYGVDLNATAVELAEVSMWLNVMHEGLEAPWFGLHLRRGNSLIGARRAVYHTDQLKHGLWRSTPPIERRLLCDADNQLINRVAEGEIHHFLLPAHGWGAIVDAAPTVKLAKDERTSLMAWRRQVRKVPTDKKTRDRLTALAKRVERLWDLTRLRIARSEDEIRRDIDVWGVDPARPLPKPATGAVPREEIVKALYDDWESPYNRLKTVMDAWCALWYWPVGQEANVEPPTVHEWLEFCEAVLGIQPKIVGNAARRTTKRPGSSAGIDDTLGLFGSFDDFKQLAEMDASDRLIARCVSMEKIAADERFGWWPVLAEIADREGFFHWELEFAQVFARGGFDLQVGNPPWVRPEWKIEDEFAEFDASAMFGSASLRDVRASVLSESGTFAELCRAMTSLEVMRTYTSDSIYYPQMGSSVANLYKNFLIMIDRLVGPSGKAAFVHPPGHMTDVKSTELRKYLYPRLERLWNFTNQLKLFEEIGNTRPFAVAVYSPAKADEIDFMMASDLLHPLTLDGSLAHDGNGEPPGIKLADGEWDTRPHATRIVRVSAERLSTWSVFSHVAAPVNSLRVMQPHTTVDAQVLGRLASWPHKLASAVELTPGLMEGSLVDRGVLEKRADYPESLRGAFIQGAHFNVHDPYYQQTQREYRNHRSYERIEISDIQRRFGIRRTGYQFLKEPHGTLMRTESFRAFFLRWVDLNGERTLQAALMPPGPVHSDVVSSVGGSDREVCLCLIALNSIVLDYLAKSAGDVDVRDEILFGLPMPRLGTLWGPALLRALRLNCRGDEYADFWNRNFLPFFRADGWTIEGLELPPLNDVPAVWESGVPLNGALARRQAQIELDALVGLGLGLSSDELVMLYKSKFPVLNDNDRRFVELLDEDPVQSSLTRPRLMRRAYEEFQRRRDSGEYPEVDEQ